MSDSAESIKKDAPITPKSFTTREVQLERLRTVEIALRADQPMAKEGEHEIVFKNVKTELLAEGGYNSVWHVSYIISSIVSTEVRNYHPCIPVGFANSLQDSGSEETFRNVVIREPNANSSPCQVENEIAFLTYLAKNHPSVPVPEIYAYSTLQMGPNSPFIAMEFIDGQPLDAIWNIISYGEKETIVNEIASIIVELGEIDLGGIGGLTLEHQLGPTVEGIKLFKGRVCFPFPASIKIGHPSDIHVRWLTSEV